VSNDRERRVPGTLNHLVILSAPDMVRMELHTESVTSVVMFEGHPDETEELARCLLDSAVRAREKGRMARESAS
jgi:hypothetical protein